MAVSSTTTRPYHARAILGIAVLFASMAGAGAPALTAQGLDATLVGSVVDPSGASVPAAKVTVRSTSTNQERELRADAKGDFLVPNLAPGIYDVVIAKEGFRTLHENGLELQLEQEARLVFHMEVGSLGQTVEVEATTPLLNTENAVKGDVVSRQELIEMPLNGRDFTDLALLTAGVSPNTIGNSGSNLAINGARADNTNFLVDGFNNQNPRDATPQARPNLDAMEEFKIQTSGYSAELGRLAGGVVNVALKSGGNGFHGAAFEFFRNDKLDAQNFFDGSTKSELRRNQFGGTVDGPVLLPKIYNGRNRTFFLVSWESYRQRQAVPTLQEVPTAADRQGIFSTPIKDPLATGACTAASMAGCFPSNKIPVSRLSPVALRIQDYFPLPNHAGVNNYYGNPVAPNDWDSYVFKVDQRLSPADTLSFRYLIRNNFGRNPVAGYIPSFLGGNSGIQALGGVTYTRIFKASLINEARFGISRTTNLGSGAHQDKDYNSLFGLPGPSNPVFQGFPIVQVTNYAYLGDAANEPMRAYITTYNSGDTVTWVKGSHALKMGAEALYFQWNNTFDNNSRGTYAFTGSWSGQPYADFLLGYLNNDSQLTGTNVSHMRNSNLGMFVADDWRITPSLTLNLGLRYELPTPAHDTEGRWASYIPEFGKYVYSSDPGVQRAGIAYTDPSKVATAQQLGLPSSLVYASHKELAPRFGFAWRPFGDNRTSVRGGYGIFEAGQLLNNVNSYLGQVFPFVITQTNNRNTANAQFLTLAAPFPTPPSLTANTSTIAVSGWQLHAPAPYLQSWNLTVEREIGWQSAIEVSYTGSKGTHLSRVYNINQPFRSAAAYPNFPVPYPGWGTIYYIGFGFDSNYNAGSIVWRRRFAQGIFFRASYVYGKSIDDASQVGVSNATSAQGTGGLQDVRNFRLERGRSDFDVRNSFTMSFSWEAPRNHGILLRGWQLAGTGTIRSGQPFTVMVNNVNAALGEAVRPNRIANGTLSNPTPERWFDVSAFPAVPTNSYLIGTAGRASLEKPGMIQVNLSLLRNFKIREKGTLQIRGEVFNFLNHANFGTPVYFVNVPNAGTITSAGDPRLVQIGMRYTF